ncbi:MAG: ABC transporter substrate-binding protein [Protaetiibacter sp.]
MSTTGGTASTVSYQLYGLVHRGLMIYGEDGTVEPALAESYEQVDDTTYDFVLRDGLSYQDGTAVTADDVRNSLLHYADPANSARSYAGMKYIESIDVADDTHLTINLSTANSSFLEYLADPSAFVVPESELEADAEATIGAGPFSLEDWDAGVGLTLTKFDGYYGADDVTLDEIDVTFYSDATARVNALLSGDVDFIDYVPWESYEQINGTSGYSTMGANGVFQSVFFNVVDGPFSDPLLRQAVAYAINRDNATEAAFFGYGESLYGIPGSDEVGENLWSYDPEKAEELLAEAGYSAGELSIHLASNSTYSFLQDLALSVQADLEAVGFTVEFTNPDWATFTEQALAGEYDVMIQGNIGNVQDPAAWLPRLVQAPAEANKSFGYSNAELDEILAEALAESDADAKSELLDEAYTIIGEDVPFATINQRTQSYGVSDRVTGFTVMPGFTQPYSVNNLIHVSMTD